MFARGHFDDERSWLHLLLLLLAVPPVGSLLVVAVALGFLPRIALSSSRILWPTLTGDIFPIRGQPLLARKTLPRRCIGDCITPPRRSPQGGGRAETSNGDSGHAAGI